MKNKNNLNTDLDNNFEEAYALCKCNFSHEELLSMLTSKSIIHRQIAALEFDYIKDEYDTIAILNNLTGCDGKIREAAAFSINRLIRSNKLAAELLANLGGETFANATVDINGNICALVVESAALLKEFKQFREDYLFKIVQISKSTLDEIDRFIFRDKKYVINKQIFKLYWCLETIANFKDFVPVNDLKEIIERSSIQKEYTIREKVANIIKDSKCFHEIKQNLINDENYYVRKIFG